MASLTPEPEQYARRLLDRLELSKADDLTHLLHGLRLTVKEVDAASFEGALVYKRDRSRGLILVSDKVRDAGRRRFTICHEIGHFILPGHGRASCRPSEIESFRMGLPQEEIDANAVASELLLPTRVLYPLVQKRKATIVLAKEVSESFDTSLTAAAVKIVLVSEEPCAFVWSEAGVSKWFKRNQKFFNFISLGELDEQSIAARLFREEKFATSEGEVFAECWLVGDHLSGKDRIWEESIYLPSYSAVLTMLTLI